MRLRALLFAFAASLTVSSCANQMYSFSYSDINQKYARQLDRVEIGMSKAELRGILPTLHVRGQTNVQGEVVEALELQHDYWAGVGGQLVHDRLWFYFHNDQLVKWGQPQDWPQQADLIVEKRAR